MKDPVPAKDKPVPAVRETAPRPARSVAVAEVRVQARFYRRMKTQRVFPLVVELQGSGASVGTAPIFVHPFIPGATVTPSELTLDPALPGGKATFYVTPLAKGTLRGARLDIFHQGRLIQELPLRMRSVTQCLTWVLAALTILIPAFLLYYTVYQPLRGPLPVTRSIPVGVEADENAGAGEKLEQPPKKEDSAGKEPDDGAGKAAKQAEKPKTSSKKAKAGKSGASQPPESAQPPGGAVSPFGETRQRTILRPADPGELLELEIRRNVPDVPATVTLPWSDEPTEVPFAITRPVASGLGTVYTHAHELAKTDHVSFWVGVALLGVTIVSAVLHRPARGRRRSEPLILAAGG